MDLHELKDMIAGLTVIGASTLLLVVVFRRVDGGLKETPRSRSIELLDEFCGFAGSPKREHNDKHAERDVASRPPG